MIEIIKAKDRHFNDFQWLQTYWLFSFSRYYDPNNIQFGALRVFNDDVVDPGTGFPGIIGQDKAGPVRSVPGLEPGREVF